MYKEDAVIKMVGSWLIDNQIRMADEAKGIDTFYNFIKFTVIFEIVLKIYITVLCILSCDFGFE